MSYSAIHAVQLTEVTGKSAAWEVSATAKGQTITFVIAVALNDDVLSLYEYLSLKTASPSSASLVRTAVGKITAPIERLTGLAWNDSGIQVVGGPVVADRDVLVNVVTPTHQAYLEAFNAWTGALQWSVRESPMRLAWTLDWTHLTGGGVAPRSMPKEDARTARRSPGDPYRHGQTVWYTTQPFTLISYPSFCPPPIGAKGVCYTNTTSALSYDQVTARQLSNGAWISGETRLYYQVVGGLYETDAKKPTFVESQRSRGRPVDKGWYLLPLLLGLLIRQRLLLRPDKESLRRKHRQQGFEHGRE